MNTIDGRYSLEAEIEFKDIIAIPGSAQLLVISRLGPTTGSNTSLSTGKPNTDQTIKSEYKSEQIKKQPLIKSCKTHKQMAQLLINSSSLYYLVYACGSFLITTLLDNTSQPLTSKFHLNESSGIINKNHVD
jgi:hypothetical protein